MLPLRPIAAASCSLFLLACGARDALSVGTNGSSTTNTTTTPACGSGALVLTTPVVLDAATFESEPEGKPTLAWSGTRLFVGWGQWNNGGYQFRFAGADLGDDGVSLGPKAFVPPGNTNNPFNPQIAWSGGGLDFFWAQDDANLRVQRFDANLVETGPGYALLGVEAGQLLATSALGVGERSLLTYGLQQTDGTWRTFALWAEQGSVQGSVGDLYAGSGYDFGAMLAQRGDEAMAVWETRAVTQPQEPIATTLAVLGKDFPVPAALEAVEEGVYRKPTGLAIEEDRLSVAIHYVTEGRIVIRSRPAAGGAFADIASIDATDDAEIAANACGGLVALVPTGELSQDNPLSTGLSLVPIDAQGTLGTPVVIPVSGEYVEQARLIATEEGYVVVWLEGGGNPGRVLRMAYVRVG